MLWLDLLIYFTKRLKHCRISEDISLTSYYRDISAYRWPDAEQPQCTGGLYFTNGSGAIFWSFLYPLKRITIVPT